MSDRRIQQLPELAENQVNDLDVIPIVDVSEALPSDQNKKVTIESLKGVFQSAGSGVESVTGESVDNTDPDNPVINAIPISGTSTSLLSGPIQIANNSAGVREITRITGTDNTKAGFNNASASPGLDLVEAEIYAENSDKSIESRVSVKQTALDIFRKDANGSVNFSITGNDVIIQASESDFEGLRYDTANIEDNFVDNSLVTKLYVENRLGVSDDADNDLTNGSDGKPFYQGLSSVSSDDDFFLGQGTSADPLTKADFTILREGSASGTILLDEVTSLDEPTHDVLILSDSGDNGFPVALIENPDGKSYKVTYFNRGSMPWRFLHNADDYGADVILLPDGLNVSIGLNESITFIYNESGNWKCQSIAKNQKDLLGSKLSQNEVDGDGTVDVTGTAIVGQFSIPESIQVGDVYRFEVTLQLGVPSVEPAYDVSIAIASTTLSFNAITPEVALNNRDRYTIDISLQDSSVLSVIVRQDMISAGSAIKSQVYLENISYTSGPIPVEMSATHTDCEFIRVIQAHLRKL